MIEKVVCNIYLKMKYYLVFLTIQFLTSDSVLNSEAYGLATNSFLTYSYFYYAPSSSPPSPSFSEPSLSISSLLSSIINIFSIHAH
jgi:hypothetical protein